MVGMRDVAKKAGVSLSTVSLVVNGNGYVSDDMRERVRKAMQALNYVPNELARNLYHDCSCGGEGLQQRLGLVECNHQRCIRTGGLDGGGAQISFTLLSDRPCNVKITPDWQAAQCRNRRPRK